MIHVSTSSSNALFLSPLALLNAPWLPLRGVDLEKISGRLGLMIFVNVVVSCMSILLWPEYFYDQGRRADLTLFGTAYLGYSMLALPRIHVSRTTITQVKMASPLVCFEISSRGFMLWTLCMARVFHSPNIDGAVVTISLIGAAIALSPVANYLWLRYAKLKLIALSQKSNNANK